MTARKQGRKLIRRAAFVTTAMGGLLTSQPLWAQVDSGGSADVTTNSQSNNPPIIVTASRRDETLAEIPQAISVLGDNVLEDVNVDDLSGFAAYVPGLETQAFSPGRNRITIRGISPDEQTGVTTISYYLDEIPLTAAGQRSQTTVRLYDIERIEVLRGPQGTLYGEGAMGGTIRIITNKPDTNDFEASMLADGHFVDGGEFGWILNGMVNVPIAQDVFAARVVVQTRETPGWIDNELLTITNSFLPPPDRYSTDRTIEDANSSTNTSVRAALRFTPVSDLTIDLTYIYDELDVDTSNIANIDQRNHRDLGLRPSTSDTELFNITINYDFEAFSVTSATSFTDRDTTQRDPQEPFLLGSPLVTSNFIDQQSMSESLTQELRIVSSPENRFRWTIGGYYRDGKVQESFVSTGFVPLLGGTTEFFSFANRSDFETFALFGEAEFDITDALTVIAGGRWFHEREELNNTSARNASGFTPRFTIRFFPTEEFMTYATYSEGYRSGGFNAFAGPPTFAPDTTENFEIGGRYTSADGSLSIGGAIYHIQWDDMQFIQLDAGGFFTFVGNANEASSTGIELEVDYRSDSGFWVRAGGNYTDAQLESDVFGGLTGVIPEGRELPAVPSLRLSAIVGYDFDISSDLTLGLSAGVTYTDDQESKLEEGGVATDPLFGNMFVIGSSIPSYATGTLRAELRNDTWSAALYVNNIWNEDAVIANDNFLPTFGQPLYYLQPRTVGMQLGLRF
ncbi:TonB-dependent receptor [Parasphingopyxis sp.]|uniref:TonB-dependent receptor n=1 Tax=Parasphingopyxis sp. TaxID=1920299 RepID=UPI0026387B8D|nr:TonB-dependent receptor [Parasphingopyxis sp.]